MSESWDEAAMLPWLCFLLRNWMVDPVYLVLLDGRVDYLLSPKPSGHSCA